MAAINFPASPNVNDTHTHNGKIWKWNGVHWSANTESEGSIQSSWHNLGGTNYSSSSSPQYDYKFYRITNDLTYDDNRIYEIVIDADDNYGMVAIYHLYLSSHNPSSTVALTKHDRIIMSHVSGRPTMMRVVLDSNEHVWIAATEKWGNIRIRGLHGNEDVTSMPFADSQLASISSPQFNETAQFIWDGDTKTLALMPTTNLTGNFGIGTATPDSELDVVGVLRAGNNESTSGGTALRVRYPSLGDHTANFGAAYSLGAPMLGYCVESSQSAIDTFVSTADNSHFGRGALVVSNELEFWSALGDVNNIPTVGDPVTMTKKLSLDSSGNLAISSGGISSSHGFASSQSSLFIAQPGGAVLNSTISPHTGSIKIQLPQSWTNTMMTMQIRVFDYSSDESFDIFCGGYNFAGSGGGWYNTFAYILSSPFEWRNFPVRFTHDGSKCCIFIGDTNQVWEYPKFNVINFTANHTADDWDKWRDGWNISIETTIPTYSNDNYSVLLHEHLTTRHSPWIVDKTTGNIYNDWSGNRKFGIGENDPNTKLHVVDSNEIVATLTNSTNAAATKTLLRFSQHEDYDVVSGNIGINRLGADAGCGFEINLADGDGNEQNRLTILEDGHVNIGNFHLQQDGVGSHIQGVTSIAFRDTTNSWTYAPNHGIMSTDHNGNLSDDISINSYHHITLRLDSNDNNSDGYVRIVKDNAVGNNVSHYFGSNTSGLDVSYLRGNVGINTTPRTDSYRLSMGGSIHMNNYQVNYADQLHFHDGMRFYGGGDDKYLRFKYDNSTEGGIKFYDGDDSLKGYIYGSDTGFGLLSSAGEWAVRIYGNGETQLYHDGSEKLNTKSTGVDITGDLHANGSHGISTNGWLRNSHSAEGLYNETNQNHFYSASQNYWHINTNSSQNNGGLVVYKQHNGTGAHATGRKGALYFSDSGFGLLDENWKWSFQAKDSEARLCYDGTEKLNTTSTGVVVTGNLGVTGSITEGGTALVDKYASKDQIRSLGHIYLNDGSGSTITTSTLIAELEGMGAFDSYVSFGKTIWSYAGNDDLTDAGRFQETAGTSFITWTDDSADTNRGRVTGLFICPTTGASAGKVFIYNDQNAPNQTDYNAGWREVWTNTSDGSGSGLDADLLDGQQGSYYLDYNNLTNTPSSGSSSENLLLNSYSSQGDGIFFRSGYTPSNNPYNMSITSYDHSNSGQSPDGLSINAYDGVSFCTGSNTRQQRMIITNDGNINIGSTSSTVNPTATLEVTAPSNEDNPLRVSGSYTGNSPLSLYLFNFSTTQNNSETTRIQSGNIGNTNNNSYSRRHHSEIYFEPNGTSGGEIAFRTGGKSGTTNATEVLRLKSNQDAEFSGSITAADGILFGSDTAAANTLHDYEEGTFNPYFTTNESDFDYVQYINSSAGTSYRGSTSGANSYIKHDGSVRGWYTKIGDMVYISIWIYTQNISTTGVTGSVRIGGLPFAPPVGGESPFSTYIMKRKAFNSFSVGYTWHWNKAPTNAVLFNDGLIWLYSHSSNTSNPTNTVVADFNTGTAKNILSITGSYRVDV